MKPSQIANRLRQIASKIERSNRPDRNLVARDLKGVIASINRTAFERPKKPSQLAEKKVNEAGAPYFSNLGWYMAYKDPNSTEYPIVVFFMDLWGGVSPNDSASPIVVMSFTSESEYKTWTHGETSNPDNVEPIDPQDADEMASTLTFFDDGSFS